jgi:glyoxylase-like metal-dependent hydrolase (beta-lactamase superfamily II)
MSTSGVTATHELAPGLHRVETIEDGKLHGYHVLEGASGPIVVDPGYADAPTEVYEPFLDGHGWNLGDVALAVLTHADADHHGGIHRLRERSPGVRVAAHAADAPLVESRDRIMAERYGQFEDDHGIAYGEEITEWLRGMMGPDEPVDLRLRGGEAFRLADRSSRGGNCRANDSIRVLHTPGHTRGHCMLYDAGSDVVIGGDGFFGRGLFDVDGEYLQPPPYFLYPEYENTIRLVEALEPDVLSFTHYEVLRGKEIEEFVAESLDFVSEIETLALEVLDERGTISLREAIDAVVEREGSFGLDLDLAYPLSAHYGDHVDRGDLEVIEKEGRVAWRRA